MRFFHQSRFLRTAIFLTFSLLLRWPTLFGLAVLRPFRYLFLVYPGTEGDLAGYCPPWLARTWLFSGKPAIGGFVSHRQWGRGLVLVIPHQAMDLLRHEKTCGKILKNLRRIHRILGTEAIALAGQMPSILSLGHGMKIQKPFVKGVKGTVFCVMETVSNVMEKHGLAKGRFKVALVGVGHVGRQLLEAMGEEGHDIVGIDVRISRRGVVLPEEGIPVLRQAEMVIVLTPRGSDFVPYMAHLKKGSIVIDDTHPRLTQKPQGCHVYKVAVGMRGVEFFPSLPGYEPRWIPGCAVEAIYATATGRFSEEEPQRTFNAAARELGFFAHLV
jgi:hypothetical protein